MSLTKKESEVINILKGILPIVVVAYHMSNIIGLNYLDSIESFFRVLFCKIGAVPVPVFFFISGFFFFNNIESWDWSIWGKKIIKRMKSLLVPFALWIIIDFIAKYFFSFAKTDIPDLSFASLSDYFCNSGKLRIFWDRPFHLFENSALGYLVDSSKPINAPLWYVRDLIVMVVMSPLIWKMLKFTKGYILILFLVINILFIGFPFTLFSPTALFFFSFGAAFSISGKDFFACFKRSRTLSYTISVIMLALSFMIKDSVCGDLVSRLFVTASVVAVFNLAGDLYDKGLRPVKLLTDSSFFIYASHAVLITEISNFILWRTLPITAEWMLVLKVFLRPAVAVGICLLIYVVMKKICPKTLALLTGGRG